MIEDASSETPYPEGEQSAGADAIDSVRLDVRRMLGMMKNPRYRLVVQRLFLDGCEYEELAVELNTSLKNLYNIKKRAMTNFTAIVLKEYGE